MDTQECYNKEKNITQIQNHSDHIFSLFTRCNKCGSPLSGCTCVQGDQDPENK